MESSMKRLCLLLTACGAFLGGVALSPAAANAAHPPVTVKLKTYEEITEQVGAMAEPRIIGANGEVRAGARNQGMPYSPKQTGGGCHTQTYDQISDHAFHSAQGRNEWVDIQKNADGSLAPLGQFANKPKPWTQGTAMYGKW